jgi:Zn-dependent M28 family amino/carboxypeptidase
MKYKSLLLLALPTALLAQRQAPAKVDIPTLTDPATPQSVRALLSVIAADSMEGRQVWTPGSHRAAKFIAEQMQKIGLVPGGDSGYFQKIPGALNASSGRIQRLPKFSDLDTVPADRRRVTVNVVGLIPGKGWSGPDSTILVDAHFDHIGVASATNRQCPPTGADVICNGADDDASGTVAVLEIARLIKRIGRQPSRTLVFAATTGEEGGLVGTRYYIDNPVRPLNSMAANLEIEMIGRPDTIAVGAGRAWLTGFERSSMGETFQFNGLPILADMRPSQQFFRRSDNIAFAQMGIPAHTLSSFNLHTDYHHATDDVSKVDFNHMATLINISARAVWVLSEAPAPQWYPGGRPCPPTQGGGRGRGGPPMTQAQQDSARIANQYPRTCPGM